MRSERERERRKPMSMGTRSARAGEVRSGAQWGRKQADGSFYGVRFPVMRAQEGARGKGQRLDDVDKT